MKTINIKFCYKDGTLIKEYSNLEYGTKVNIPKPKKYFYKFTGWTPKVNKKAQSDQIYYANFKAIQDINKNNISNEEEFLQIIDEVINNKEYLKRKNYCHHGDESVYEHCFAVAYYTYKMCKKLKLDYKSATIGAILHDFYYKDWQKNTDKQPFFKQHGFVHAHEALENSREYFPDLMNKKSENCIQRHMFPLNICPPKYPEAWIVSLADKYASMGVIENPTIFLSFFIKKYRK